MLEKNRRPPKAINLGETLVVIFLFLSVHSSANCGLHLRWHVTLTSHLHVVAVSASGQTPHQCPHTHHTCKDVSQGTNFRF